MRDVHFSVIGEPKGKSRPRFARNGNKVRTYTPEETVSFENLITWTYAKEYPSVKLEGKIAATICAYFPIPQSTSQRKRQKMLLDDVFYDHKPDTDNIAKAVLDALNNVAYDDDRQIVSLNVEKYYSPLPRVEVWLRELEGDAK